MTYCFFFLVDCSKEIALYQPQSSAFFFIWQRPGSGRSWITSTPSGHLHRCISLAKQTSYCSHLRWQHSWSAQNQLGRCEAKTTSEWATSLSWSSTTWLLPGTELFACSGLSKHSIYPLSVEIHVYQWVQASAVLGRWSTTCVSRMWEEGGSYIDNNVERVLHGLVGVIVWEDLTGRYHAYTSMFQGNPTRLRYLDEIVNLYIQSFLLVHGSDR